jgi:conjugal transfer pilus assembly protein TraU
MHNFLASASFLILIFISSAAQTAETSISDSLSCPDAELFGPKLFTDICWSCLFPIRVAGFSITPGDAPDLASTESTCLCASNGGPYMPGIVNSMWEPARIIELVRRPGCSMALGGANLNFGSLRQFGTLTESPGGDAISSEKLSFYNVHYYAFPLMSILELYMPKRCSPDGYTDFDIIQLSEIDPTWNNDELAFFTHPESAAVSNPIAQAACAADATFGLAGAQPLESLWWCAGTWGGLYPMAGAGLPNDFSRSTSLLAARTIGLMHRRGFAHLTMGDETICRGHIFPTIPKTQYKMAMFFPRPETKKGHYIGAHPMTWQGGEGRAIPKVGEDALYMMFRWNDCCNTL